MFLLDGILFKTIWLNYNETFRGNLCFGIRTIRQVLAFLISVKLFNNEIFNLYFSRQVY